MKEIIRKILNIFCIKIKSNDETTNLNEVQLSRYFKEFEIISRNETDNYKLLIAYRALINTIYTDGYKASVTNGGLDEADNKIIFDHHNRNQN